MEGKFVVLSHKSPLPCAEAPTKIFLDFCKPSYLMAKKASLADEFV